MRRMIPLRIALIGTMLILSAIVVFHALIIISVLPFDVVWGGRLSTRQEMLKYEFVALALNLFMLLVMAIHSRTLKVNVPKSLTRLVIWLMFALFVLNSLGNLFSENAFERMIFTPLTVLLAIFCLRSALPERKSEVQ